MNFGGSRPRERDRSHHPDHDGRALARTGKFVKTCIACNIEKPEGQFHRYGRGYKTRRECKECLAEKRNSPMSPLISRTSRPCKTCGIEKGISDFPPVKGSRDGHGRHCRLCVREKRRSPEAKASAKKSRRDFSHRNHAYALLVAARSRAKSTGMDCTITVEDIIIPENCPILGIPLIRGKGKATWNSPSIDRIDNSQGYTPDNIIIISKRANSLKSNASVKELQAMAKFFLIELGNNSVRENFSRLGYRMC